MSSMSDAKAGAAKARAELAATLDSIEEKFDVKKRVGEVGGKADNVRKQAVAAYQKNPVPFIVGAAAVGVVAIGLIAWAVFGRDDD